MTVLPVNKLEPSARRAATVAVGITAVVSAAFCLTIAALLLRAFVQDQYENPLDNTVIPETKRELTLNPNNTAAVEKIKQRDYEIRAGYFKRRAFTTTGAWMLFGGAIVMLVALKLRKELRTDPYMPQPDDAKAETKATVVARQAVSFSGAILAGSLVAIAMLPKGPALSSAQKQTPGGGTSIVEQPPAKPLFTPEEWAKNWPVFRGPTGGGIVANATPLEWDGASSKNILWKSEIPLGGHGSPIVWGDNVFVCGATEAQREVFCFSAADGKLKWRTPVGKGNKVELNEGTSFAPSTPATDGQRVYAIFPTGDLAAVDLSGKIAWEKPLGVPENNYGHSTSLAFCKDRLIVQIDQGGKTSGKSALLAFDGATGKQLWKTPRPVAASWASPIVIEHNGKPQIITVAEPFAIAHDPETGAILWQSKVISGEIAPSAVFADGVVYACQDRSDLTGTKVDGAGDVTKTHVLKWKYSDNLPDTASPLVYAGLVYLATSSGTVTAVDAQKGEEVWSQQIEKAAFYASPFVIGDRLYFPDRTGTTHVLAAGKEFKKIAEYKLPGEFHASPAFAGGRMYARLHQGGKDAPAANFLYCIGPKN